MEKFRLVSNTFSTTSFKSEKMINQSENIFLDPDE